MNVNEGGNVSFQHQDAFSWDFRLGEHVNGRAISPSNNLISKPTLSLFPLA